MIVPLKISKCQHENVFYHTDCIYADNEELVSEYLQL